LLLPVCVLIHTLWISKPHTCISHHCTIESGLWPVRCAAGAAAVPAGETNPADVAASDRCNRGYLVTLPHVLAAPPYTVTAFDSAKLLGFQKTSRPASAAQKHNANCTIALHHALLRARHHACSASPMCRCAASSFDASLLYLLHFVAAAHL
jgi:hypothetical protein